MGRREEPVSKNVTRCLSGAKSRDRGVAVHACGHSKKCTQQNHFVRTERAILPRYFLQDRIRIIESSLKILIGKGHLL